MNRDFLRGPLRPILYTAYLNCFLVASAAMARDVEPIFAFSKPVELPSLSEESLVAIPLDADVYTQTQEGLGDIRLLDAQVHTVPFLLRKRQSTSTRVEHVAWPARNLAVHPLENDGLEITITLADDDPRPTGLRLITPLSNFEQRIRVESSNDGDTWEPAAADTAIFDYARYIDVRNDSVGFPETAHRHFRITIDDVTAEQESQLTELTRRLRGDLVTERFSVDRRPFRIDRIEFQRDAEHEHVTGDELLEYPLSSFTVEELDSEKQTVITLTTRREPLTSIAIATPSRNFSRLARVEVEHGEGDHRERRTIGQGTLSQIDFGGLHREELKIVFPETRQTTYRVAIDNRDSPPLKIEGVRAEGTVYELVAFAEPTSDYTLAYANDKASSHQYDVAALNTLLIAGRRPVSATLGTERTNPAASEPRPASWREFLLGILNNPVLLTCLVVVLVMFLGWGLYHAARRVDSLPDDGE